MKGSSARWWWAVAWMGFIFATSCGVVTTGQLAHAVTTTARGRVTEDGFIHFWRVAWWFFVKGWHAVEFGVLFLLVRRFWPKWAWAVALGYAFVDELHQLFVPARGARLSDVCIDGLGILAAWWICERWSGARPWLRLVVALAWIGAVFLLSTHSFGLVEIVRGTGSGQP